MSVLAVVLIACAVLIVIGAEWPRLTAKARAGGEARTRRERDRRKTHLRVIQGDRDEFAESVKRGVGGNATFTWVDADFLIANNAQPYGRELPVFQVMRGRTAGFAQFDLTPEIRAGLRFRPTEVTARETLAWWRTLPADRQAAIRTGFSAERETALLALWKAR